MHNPKQCKTYRYKYIFSKKKTIEHNEITNSNDGDCFMTYYLYDRNFLEHSTRFDWSKLDQTHAPT